MARGVSLHIGLNEVDPNHYKDGDGNPWKGELAACEADAHAMVDLATAQKFEVRGPLLSKQATSVAVVGEITKVAGELEPGDIFFLTYSGHGGQVDDVSGEEDDKLDETWCLYDGELIDDELYLELSRFAKGVRVLVLSDSCHSGTVTRAQPPPPIPGQRPKLMPPEIAKRVYAEHKDFYDRLQRAVMRASKSAAPGDPDAALAHAHAGVSSRLTNVSAACKAAVLLISGCQDNQTSMDGDHNGAFTEQLLKVWNQGGYRGNYAKFHAAIKAQMPRSQTPNLFTLGPAAAFAQQQPFAV